MPDRGGSVSRLSKSFLSPLLAARAALLASMRRWVRAFSALTCSSRSFTSVDHASRASERTGSFCRLVLSSLFRLASSWIFRPAVESAWVFEDVVRIAFKFSTSIFQSINERSPCLDEMMISQILCAQFFSKTNLASSSRYSLSVRVSMWACPAWYQAMRRGSSMASATKLTISLGFFSACFI